MVKLIIGSLCLLDIHYILVSQAMEALHHQTLAYKSSCLQGHSPHHTLCSSFTDPLFLSHIFPLAMPSAWNVSLSLITLPVVHTLPLCTSIYFLNPAFPDFPTYFTFPQLFSIMPYLFPSWKQFSITHLFCCCCYLFNTLFLLHWKLPEDRNGVFFVFISIGYIVTFSKYLLMMNK